MELGLKKSPEGRGYVCPCRPREGSLGASSRNWTEETQGQITVILNWLTLAKSVKISRFQLLHLPRGVYKLCLVIVTGMSCRDADSLYRPLV